MPAALLTEVGTEWAAGALPPGVVMLMMRPPPWAFMCGIASREQRMAPNTFNSMSYLHVSSDTFSKYAAAEVPALFTSMSIRPCASITRSNSA